MSTDAFDDLLAEMSRKQEERDAVEVARMQKLLDAGLTEEQIQTVGEVFRELIMERDEQFEAAVKKRDRQWRAHMRRLSS